MKHVFVINSHTTFLTSMGAVEYLDLKAEDVVFLYVRNYRNAITAVPFTVYEVTELANSCDKITRNYMQKVSNIDTFVNEHISGSYHLYVPHMWHWFHKILYTNSKCKRVAYVQEGGPAQTKVCEYDVPLLERIKAFIRHAILRKRIFECKWYKRGTLYKQRHVDAFAINDVYFHEMYPRTHIVKWPTTNLNMQLDTTAPIFIFDGHVTNGLVEPEVYMQLCKQMISEQAHSMNYVKFHPAQRSEEREDIINFFSHKGLKVEVMRDDIPTEYVIIQFRGLTFVGFTSSLLYYAKDNGHHVVCYEKQLTDNSKRYAEHVKANGFQTFRETYHVSH